MMTKTVKQAIEELQQGATDDLWQQLDAAMQEITKPVRPPNSFTRKEFESKYDLSYNQAKRQLEALSRAGKITKHGHSTSTYYMMVK